MPKQKNDRPLYEFAKSPHVVGVLFRILLLTFLTFSSTACAKPFVARVDDKKVTEFQRGVGLGLFASDENYDYKMLLDEIRDHGATDVLIVVAWYQKNISSDTLAPRKGYSPTRETITRTIAQAKERNLRVSMLPIIRLQEREPDEWRGKIAPALGHEKWFVSYGRYIEEMAAIADESGVARLGVGSELLSMEKHRDSWVELISKVRKKYRGKLFYSANWDHFDPVTFWDKLDEVGVTAYFELVKDGEAPTPEKLRSAWRNPRADFESLRKRVKKPVFISEVGYPSKKSAARYPWDETRDSPLDMALQAELYDAFCDAFSSAEILDGVYFWNWFGFGGALDGEYTPRGKPAAKNMKHCLEKKSWKRFNRPTP